MIYLELFLAFLKVGLFSFGGAYSAIPLIREVVLSYGWLTDEKLTHMIAVSESTPGPIMVNLATYVGSSQGGLPGAFVATFAVVLPSFFIILLVMILLNNFIQNGCVQAVMHSMTPCIIGIILATGIFMIADNIFSVKNTVFDVRGIIITAALFIVLYGYKHIRKAPLSPIILIIISACLGAAVYSF